MSKSSIRIRIVQALISIGQALALAPITRHKRNWDKSMSTFNATLVQAHEVKQQLEAEKLRAVQAAHDKEAALSRAVNVNAERTCIASSARMQSAITAESEYRKLIAESLPGITLPAA